MTQTQNITAMLAGMVGEDFAQDRPEIRERYRVDGLEPRTVVFPRNTKEVAEVIRFAHAEGLAVVPWGSGTKMGMGLPPRALDVVVSTSRLNHMLDVDTANLTITVEAGVKFRDIQARLATEEDRCYLPLEDLSAEGDEFVCSDRSHSGCFLPLDPPHGKTATIGGIIAANSTGSRRLLYNLPRDVILGVRFVTPTGEIAGAGGKTVKNVSGYDTSKLMTGSMGSLGILCEMTFKLLPLPEAMETLLFSFEHFDDAARLANRILETSLLPAAVDLINGPFLDRIDPSQGGLGATPYAVAVALEGFREAVERMSGEIGALAAECGRKGRSQLREVEHRRYWLAVSDLPGRLAQETEGLIRTRFTYPVSRWEALVRDLEAALEKGAQTHVLQVHAGSGVCFLDLLIEEGQGPAQEEAARILDGFLSRTTAVGGNLVVERAPAALKNRLKVWGEPGSDFVVMKRIKERVDPRGIMNPGRFVGGL